MPAKSNTTKSVHHQKVTSLEAGKRFQQEWMKILSFRGEDGSACGTLGSVSRADGRLGDLCQACPAHSAVIPDRGRAAWRVGAGRDLQKLAEIQANGEE